MLSVELNLKQEQQVHFVTQATNFALPSVKGGGGSIEEFLEFCLLMVRFTYQAKYQKMYFLFVWFLTLHERSCQKNVLASAPSAFVSWISWLVNKNHRNQRHKCIQSIYKSIKISWSLSRWMERQGGGKCGFKIWEIHATWSKKYKFQNNRNAVT